MAICDCCVILHVFSCFDLEYKACSVCGCYKNEEGGGLGATIKNADLSNCKKCLKIIEEEDDHAIHTKR